MFSQVVFRIEFFEGLLALDAKIAELARQARCPRCEGPLHRADYGRKPRGGALAGAGEAQTTRFSFCCGAEGCRRRATPPSLRFLGRRVYIEACVIVASVVSVGLARAKAVREATGVPARTVARWRAWWASGFVSTAVFIELSSRFIGAASAEFPRAILERMSGPAIERIGLLARWLSPLTTATVPDGARFARRLA